MSEVDTYTPIPMAIGVLPFADECGPVQLKRQSGGFVNR